MQARIWVWARTFRPALRPGPARINGLFSQPGPACILIKSTSHQTSLLPQHIISIDYKINVGSLSFDDDYTYYKQMSFRDCVQVDIQYNCTNLKEIVYRSISDLDKDR